VIGTYDKLCVTRNFWSAAILVIDFAVFSSPL
jgi:hypothetical protein